MLVIELKEKFSGITSSVEIITPIPADAISASEAGRIAVKTPSTSGEFLNLLRSEDIISITIIEGRTSASVAIIPPKIA